MRAFACPAKSRKLIAVGSPDELPKTTIVPLGLDPRDRRGERGAAGGFEDQREGPHHLVDPFDDLVGAAHMPAALGPADDRSDPSPRACGDLHRHVSHTSGGASDQHAFADQRAAMAQGAQRRQAGNRQGRGFLELHIVGQCRHAMGGDGGPLRPTGIVGQRDDAGTGRRAAAVGCLF